MLEMVTITGADDFTKIKDMVELSSQYPWVEWGILVSRKRERQPRFPSSYWMRQLADAAAATPMRISMHMCGVWVRQLYVGELRWAELPPVAQIAQRVQLNTHADRHVSTLAMIDVLDENPRKFIFQLDGVNDHFMHAARAFGIDACGLFDRSHGAGVTPTSWPKPYLGIHCGYAGGIGRDNVVEQVAKVEEVCAHPFWIDMEGKVRTDDNARLDMEQVRGVLEQCAPMVPTKVAA